MPRRQHTEQLLVDPPIKLADNAQPRSWKRREYASPARWTAQVVAERQPVASAGSGPKLLGERVPACHDRGALHQASFRAQQPVSLSSREILRRGIAVDRLVHDSAEYQ